MNQDHLVLTKVIEGICEYYGTRKLPIIVELTKNSQNKKYRVRLDIFVAHQVLIDSNLHFLNKLHTLGFMTYKQKANLGRWLANNAPILQVVCRSGNSDTHYGTLDLWKVINF